MLDTRLLRRQFYCLFIFWLGGLCPVLGAGWKILPGHVPTAVTRLSAIGNLPSTNRLHLAISLPLRDPAGLKDFLEQLYDPKSPGFRNYLAPEDFTARFGPTEADYAAITNFALTNGFTITATHGNRLILDVEAPVSAIQKAFHLTLHSYQHPTEKRHFFAPDTAPTVDASLPMADIIGLNNYVRPHPKFKRVPVSARPQNGSGYGGGYMGNDFRQAYVPGTTLTGAGQSLGLFELDGFYSNDITAYEQAAGIPSIPIQIVQGDAGSEEPGFGGVPGAPTEVSLDIEMGMSIAPGLADIVVFEGTNADDVLEAIVENPQVHQISCSWGWGGSTDPTADTLFQEMAAQGQSFFNASGDSDAYTTGANSANPTDASAPSSSPYIIQVGGTELTTDPNGNRVSETVWNTDYNGAVGSSGGISSVYSIPSWQTNVSMTSGGGSAQQRNIPDVAMAADQIVVYSEDGGIETVQGTSCAAPLWAGFAALANEQALANGVAPIGFINPALYRLARSATQNNTYGTYFYDVISGNNESAYSPTQFVAAVGYDLCTGLGSPSGTNLINELVAMDDSLKVVPGGNFVATGVPGGPFTTTTFSYTFTNTGTTSLGWVIKGVPSWMTLSPTSGTLAKSAAATVSVALNTSASNLVVGVYTGSLLFSNVTTHVGQSRSATLNVIPMLEVSPATGFSANGPFGGPFVQGPASLTVSNLGNTSINWFLVNTSAWLTVSPTNGTLSANGGSATLSVVLASAASTLSPGTYATTLQFTNVTNHASQQVPATLSIGQNLVQNGGFEDGDFQDWTLVGDAQDEDDYGDIFIYDGVVSASSPIINSTAYIYSGNYAAVLGESGTTATLSQTVPTVPGASYELSFWLVSPGSLPTEEFEVNWNGTNVYSVLNPPTFGWTNLNFLVTATGTNSVLLYTAENDNDFFGLDDVSVTPIPIVSFQSMEQSNNSWKLTWDATAGLVYQVQYKTNLLQSDWINLGGAITAAANTITVTDTNSLILSPQRYYRLEVSP